MVLSVDIGNSNICIGGLAGAEHREIAFTTRMVTRPRCTVDEYAAEMKFLLHRLTVEPTACEGVIVCSVVPRLTGVLAAACKRLTGKEALIVSCELDTGLTFQVDEPAKVGRDRLAGARRAAQPAGHQRGHGAAAPHCARAARASDWRQHGGCTEQRGHVWHCRPTGRTG